MGPKSAKMLQSIIADKIYIQILSCLGYIIRSLFLLEKPGKGGSSTRRHDEGLLYDNAALETTDTWLMDSWAHSLYFFSLLVSSTF